MTGTDMIAMLDQLSPEELKALQAKAREVAKEKRANKAPNPELLDRLRNHVQMFGWPQLRKCFTVVRKEQPKKAKAPKAKPAKKAPAKKAPKKG